MIVELCSNTVSVNMFLFSKEKRGHIPVLEVTTVV
jgi:hypothetical protein